MAHCHREFLHAQWKLLLDDEFMEAYEHGIVITCGDGITRRVFPRIFTYSADYPEKYVISIMVKQPTNNLNQRVLLAGIRNLGSCPCPRCRVPLKLVHDIGTRRDMSERISLARVDDNDYRTKISSARELIFRDGYQVDSAAVNNLLKGESLVPVTVRLCIVVTRVVL